MDTINRYSGYKKIAIHLSFWIALCLSLSLFVSPSQEWSQVVQRNSVLILLLAGIVYWNINVLFPKFYLPKKYYWYFFLSVLSIFLFSYTLSWLFDLLFDPTFPHRPKRGFSGRGKSGSQVFRYIARMSPFILAFALSSIYKMTQLTNRREQETANLRGEKLETEIKFLKSQINPHFLFNALNNIYSQTVIQSPAAPDNLLKLSNILRYMLYECNADKVPLRKEIEYLKNYVDLKLLKDSRGLNLELALEEAPAHLQIAPMLFIPFVENAFKHSKIEDLNQGWIKISLQIKEKTLNFEVKNSNPTTEFSKDKVGGIGLNNVKRQLDLLYPEKHQLLIEPSKDQFRVHLKLDLV